MTMNKHLKKIGLLSIFLLGVTSYSHSAEAQLFGSDDEKWKKVFIGLKKINSRLVKLETSELANMIHQLEDLLRQIEEVKQTLPQLQGSVELSKSEILTNSNHVRSRINDLEAGIKNKVLSKIDQQNKVLELFKEDQKKLRAILTRDLIPALRNENSKTRQSTLDEIEKLKFSQNRLEGKLDELLRIIKK